MFRKVLAIVPAIMILTLPVLASAHVVVTPSQVGVGEEPIFRVSVPNEQQTAAVSVKLDIPDGVSGVTPTVKDGWTIETTTNNAKDPEITAITWSAGNIPVGQREDFSFGAQVPASATQLDWKAYQTYADGTVVHWDQTPAGSDDSTGNAGPYSVTKVVNDLTSTTTPTAKSNTILPLILSIVAIVLSFGGLLFKPRPKK